jgi:hypothetical protein
MQETIDLKIALVEVASIKEMFFKGKINDLNFDKQIIKIIDKFVNHELKRYNLLVYIIYSLIFSKLLLKERNGE